MYDRTSRTQAFTPSSRSSDEKKSNEYFNDKEKRFKSPMSSTVSRLTKNVFKSNKNDIEYRRLEEKDEQYSDLQFKPLPMKIPYHAIILATVLFLFGVILITLGTLILTGHIETDHHDRSWPLIFIGSLVFIPGFYHLRIAYWAWKGDKNFSFADIPDLDWF